MLHGRKLVCTFALLGALGMPAMIHARPVPQDHRDWDHDRDHDREVRRYYDSRHHDYHEWGPREDVAYRRWLAERHRQYMEFGRLTPAQQRAYWEWRHAHPDVR
jgi:hypothetical protein